MKDWPTQPTFQDVMLLSFRFHRALYANEAAWLEWIRNPQDDKREIDRTRVAAEDAAFAARCAFIFQSHTPEQYAATMQGWGGRDGEVYCTALAEVRARQP